MIVIPFTEHDRWYVDYFLDQAIEHAQARYWARLWRRLARGSRYERRRWAQDGGPLGIRAWPRPTGGPS